MPLPATDSFTGGGGTTIAITTYSANWTGITGEAVPAVNQVADVVEPNSVGGDSGAYWNADTFANNQYAQIKAITAAASDKFVSPVLRCAVGARTYYCVGVTGALGGSVTYEFFKRVAGVRTTLGSTGSTTINTTDVIRAEISGDTITFKVNGGTITTRSDSSIASGSAGLFLYADTGAVTDAQLDDWEGGDLTAAGATKRASTRMTMGVGL